jgi:hypothetical protein
MTQQIINIGTADQGNGDPLRTAFNKVNENFTELFAALGLNSDGLNIGSFEFTDNIITTTDSSNIIIDQAVAINSELTVHGDIVPNIGAEHNLGSLEKPFKSIYVSGQTVYFNGIPLSVDDNGEISINNNRLVQDNGNYISLNLNVNDVQISDPQVGDTLQWTGGFWVNGPNGGGGSISVGDGNGPSVDNVTEILINGTITEIEPGIVGISVSGGTNQPYLELTNTPLIIQPVISGTPVTVTAAAEGELAQVEIVIGEGPVITSINVTSAGTGYAVGQRYRVWYYQVGGNNDDSSIEFEVATVGENGELLTIVNTAFTGISLSNIPGTYSGVSIELRSSMVFDEIGPGLTLTRDRVQALYNSELELEYDNDTYLSPLGTEWNNDGWDNLVGFRVRNYTTLRSALNNAVGNNIIGAELIMRDVANDRYYKFSFSVWGGNNGAYTYTRTEITDPNFFEKLDYATANDVDVIEDDSTLQIGITRGNNNGIYNPFTEEGWDSDVSPQGTLWNIDGWDDFADVETRTYTNFYDAYDGNLGNRVPGSKSVMYVPSIDKYYAIQWLRWTQNNQGGGFSYLRYEIDLTKLQEGITFADGTVQKTAYVPTNVKLRSPGERRIEEVYGYNEVSVTVRTTGNTVTTTAVNSNAGNTWYVDISATGEVRQGLIDLNNGDAFYEIEISVDESNWIKGRVGGWGESSIQITFNDGATLSFAQGDTVYYRVITGSDPQVWWDKDELPSGGNDFRGAVIDYHAYIPGRGTIVGTIHIVDDDGDEHITHTEVTSGSSSLEYTDLWLVTSEGEIKYRQLDGDNRTLKVQWTAKVFYGSEYYDD